MHEGEHVLLRIASLYMVGRLIGASTVTQLVLAQMMPVRLPSGGVVVVSVEPSCRILPACWPCRGLQCSEPNMAALVTVKLVCGESFPRRAVPSPWGTL